MDHPKGLSRTAAFRQLDVYSVSEAHEPRDVRGNDARLVEDDRQGRTLEHLSEPLAIGRGQRLLDEFDAVVRQEREPSQRLFGAPGRVRVHPQGRLWRFATHDLEGLLVSVRAHLDLQDRVLACASDLLGHDLGLIDPDRERAERSFRGLEAPEHPERTPEDLPLEIVKGGGDRGPRGAVAAQSSFQCAFQPLDRLGADRLIHTLDHGPVGLEGVDDGLRALPVEGRRVGLPPALQAFGLDTDPDDRLALPGRSADREGILQLQPQLLPAESQGPLRILTGRRA